MLAALKAGKWTLECEEILAFGQAITWAVRLDSRIKQALEAPDAPPPAAEPPPVEPASTERVHDVPHGRARAGKRKGV